jgi:hypothetical protein
MRVGLGPPLIAAGCTSSEINPPHSEPIGGVQNLAQDLDIDTENDNVKEARAGDIYCRAATFRYSTMTEPGHSSITRLNCFSAEPVIMTGFSG